MTSEPLTLRLALLQLTGCGRDLEASHAKAERHLRRAAAAGADIALLPEMWSIGYRAFDPGKPRDREAWLATAVARDGEWVESFRLLAAELQMAIAITYLERWPGAPRNVLTLIDCTGSDVLHYAKTHLCPWGPPDTACTPGDEFPVAALTTRAGPVRVGAMICFDREFPEAARLLMLGGAELILVPNACDLATDAVVGDARIAQLRGRAFENGVAIAMANYAAPQHDGRSLAVGPNGSVLALGDAEEQILFADLDLAAVRDWRRSETGRETARRAALYGALADPRRRSTGG